MFLLLAFVLVSPSLATIVNGAWPQCCLQCPNPGMCALGMKQPGCDCAPAYAVATKLKENDDLPWPACCFECSDLVLCSEGKTQSGCDCAPEDGSTRELAHSAQMTEQDIPWPACCYECPDTILCAAGKAQAGCDCIPGQHFQGLFKQVAHIRRPVTVEGSWPQCCMDCPNPGMCALGAKQPGCDCAPPGLLKSSFSKVVAETHLLRYELREVSDENSALGARARNGATPREVPSVAAARLPSPRIS